jgi:hypothetical protein
MPFGPLINDEPIVPMNDAVATTGARGSQSVRAGRTTLEMARGRGARAGLSHYRDGVLTDA